MDDLAYNQFLKLEKTHWWFIGRRRIVNAVLSRYLEYDPDRLIMDVGCGFGGMLEGLSRHGHAMGMEIDLKSARLCKERGYDPICLGSGYTLPIQENTLDLITLFDALEHIEDDRKVITQCAAALKPAGHLLITVPAYQFLFAENDRVAHHLRRYTLSDLKRKVHAAGLKTLKGSYYNFLLFPPILCAVMLLKAKQALRGPLPPGRTGATNLSYRYPGPVHSLLRKIFCLESRLLTRLSAPFGHSIVLLARKGEA
jgi:SAM-dependent methyltransferase